MSEKTTAEPKVDSMAGSVSVLCSKTGCPRKAKAPIDDTMPAGTAKIVMPCPWHLPHGGYSEERYFDKHQNELFHKHGQNDHREPPCSQTTD